MLLVVVRVLHIYIYLGLGSLHICCLKSLETLNISFCSKLEELPEHLGNMESLAKILAYGTSIKLLPFSTGDLKNLRNVSLGGFMDNAPSSKSWFSSLSFWFSQRNPISKSLLLPASFACLSSLQRLELCHCNLTEDSIPNLGNLNLLKHLNLGGNSFFRLPTGIRSLTNLEILDLKFCKNLVSISELPLNLKALIAYNCISLERLSIQSKNSPHLISLPGCEKLVEILGLENVENLSFIHIENYDNLASDFKEKFLQVVSRYKHILSISLPGSEVPNWFSYRVEGSSLSFYIPLVLDGDEIQGLFICAVYYGLKCAASPFARIRNKSNGLEYIHRYSHSSTLISYSLDHKDHIWVSYVPFYFLPFARKGGEELEMSVIAEGDFEVKKCGVHLAANVGKMVKTVGASAKRGYGDDNDEAAESSSISDLSSEERCSKRSRRED